MFSKDVYKTLQIAWPLLAGIGLMMTGNGLQGTLLSLRAYAENFPFYETGLIMSAYYFGYLIGCIAVPKLIASVGHIRVFAGFASLASTTILLHGLFVDPWIWVIIRIISGFSFVGLFVVAESWLNSLAPNNLRARIFSAYLLVVHGGLFAGQFLIALASVKNLDLFILVSILVSLALIPITLANKPAPGYEEPEHLPLRKLFSFSVFPLAGVFASGLAGAAIFTMGPIYARESGFNDIQIAYFVSAYILGATIFPVILGWISDRINRRSVLLVITILALSCSLLILSLETFLIPLIFVLGGLVVSLYSISIAFMNDRLKPSQITSASASLILINGIGGCAGPFLTGILIDWLGKNGMFLMLSVLFLALLVIGIYRAFTGRKVAVSDQSEFFPVPARSSPMVIQIHEPE